MVCDAVFSGKSASLEHLLLETAGSSEILTYVRLHDITPQMTVMFIASLFM